MLLERVLPHPEREEVYLDYDITPPEEISDEEKRTIKRILLKEIDYAHSLAFNLETNIAEY